jgi:hypothetical protein
MDADSSGAAAGSLAGASEPEVAAVAGGAEGAPPDGCTAGFDERCLLALGIALAFGLDLAFAVAFAGGFDGRVPPFPADEAAGKRSAKTDTSVPSRRTRCERGSPLTRMCTFSILDSRQATPIRVILRTG